MNRALLPRDRGPQGGVLLVGNPDVEGLSLALSGWSADLRTAKTSNAAGRVPGGARGKALPGLRI
jgi:hypothetical protein